MHLLSFRYLWTQPPEPPSTSIAPRSELIRPLRFPYHMVPLLTWPVCRPFREGLFGHQYGHHVWTPIHTLVGHTLGWGSLEFPRYIIASNELVTAGEVGEQDRGQHRCPLITNQLFLQITYFHLYNLLHACQNHTATQDSGNDPLVPYVNKVNVPYVNKVNDPYDVGLPQCNSVISDKRT